MAHTDRIKEQISIKYDDLYKAYEILKEMTNKYNLLIRASRFIELAPQPQGYWEEVLTISWIEPK